MGSVETSLLIFVPKTSLRSLLKLTLNQVEFGVACCKIYLTQMLCVFQFVLSQISGMLEEERGRGGIHRISGDFCINGHSLPVLLCEHGE